MLKFKEGQTYICEKSFTRKWIEGKEYETTYDEISEEYIITDELGFIFFDWELNESRHVFKLKEKTNA